MAAKTKRELEDQIEKLEAEKSELHAEIRKMKLNADRGFEDSHERAKLLDNINYLQILIELEQSKSADWEKRYKQAQRILTKSSTLQETDYGEPSDQVEQLEDQLEEAKITISVQQRTMRQLRNIIDDLCCGKKVAYPHQAPKSGVRGRPRNIDDQTKQRVRKLRHEGYTMRQIAAAEDISLSSVNNILKAKK